MLLSGPARHAGVFLCLGGLAITLLSIIVIPDQLIILLCLSGALIAALLILVIPTPPSCPGTPITGIIAIKDPVIRRSESVSTVASVGNANSLCPICLADIDEVLEEYMWIGGRYLAHLECVDRHFLV